MSWAKGLTFSYGDSFMHRLNPFSKAGLAFFFLISAICVYRAWEILLALLVLTFIPAFSSGQVKSWCTTLKAAAFFSILIAILDFVFVGGLLFSVTMGLRFLVVVSAFSVYSLTTSPEDTADAMLKAGFPYWLVTAFAMSVRFIPLISDEAQTIMEAQVSRGYEFKSRNPISLIKKYVPLLVPLLVISVMRADEAAQALETRGFGYTRNVTTFSDLRFREVDLLVLLLALAGTAAMVYVRLWLSPSWL